MDKIKEARDLFRRLELMGRADEAVERVNMKKDINCEALRRFKIQGRISEIRVREVLKVMA